MTKRETLTRIKEAIGEGEDEVALARRFVESNPQLRPAWTALAQAQEACGNLKDSVSSYQTALEFARHEAIPVIWAKIGILKRELGELDQAEDAYRRALELCPDEGGFHILLGGTLAKQGRYEEAKRHHNRGIELGNGDTDEAYLNLAYIERRQGNLALALEHVNRALELCPEYPKAEDLKEDLLNRIQNPDPAG